jgi:hypothetical protein
LILVVVVGVLLAVDAAAKQAVQRGGTYALGVNTSVNSVSVGVLSGRLSMSGLKVDNPSGFKADRFLTMGDGRVAVSLGSLTKDTIEVPEVALENIDVNLERLGDKANYDVILGNLKKLSGANKPAPSEKEKRLVINDLTIKKVTVRANMLGVGGAASDLTTVTVPIEEIHLSNIGKTGSGAGGSGVTVSELTSVVVQAVLAAAAKTGGNILGPIAGDLQNAVAQLGGLQDVGVQVIGTAGQAAEQIGKAAEGVGKELEKGLKELLPGGKK